VRISIQEVGENIFFVAKFGYKNLLLEQAERPNAARRLQLRNL
jgi:hypothetical protein